MIVYERYHQDPAGLHEWLEWEHSHDPWAVAAIAGWRKRRGRPVPIDVGKLKDLLSRAATQPVQDRAPCPPPGR